MTDARLERLALRVLEGDAVDWDAVGANDGELVANLRLVASIGETLRRQADDGDDLVRHLHETWSDIAASGGTALKAGSHWGPLEIRGLLGVGASAEVYRAWDEALQREVALKLFRSDDPGLQQRMLTEGRRMARVDHPGVVRVHGADQHDGRVGLWMERIRGETLAERVARERLGAAETAAVGQELCDAIAAIHAAGLVHGDIKAQNVIRSGDGRLVLTDFGSSAELAVDDATPALSGTPLYLAPEVIAGESPSARSDIYSLGVLLFHLLSGDYPVNAPSLPRLRDAHRDGERKLLADLRPGLEPSLVTAIERALANAPAERFESAGAFAQALGRPGATGSVSTGRRTWLGMAAVGAVLIAGWWLLQPSAPEYTLDSRLYRLAEDASPARLENGAAVSVGDRLSLELTASQDLYVWVFNEDDAGNAHALFPIDGLGPSNPLPGGERHVLPGGESPVAWVVDRPAGMDRIHVVTSPDPQPGLAALFADLAPASLDPGLFSPRGIGSVQSIDTRPTRSAAPLLQAIGDPAHAGIGATGLNHQVIELRHAGD